MKYRFLLNNIEINEPIGFDGFKPVIERTDHHGMSVSTSLDKIGFYGNAFDIINDAYNADVDIELPFVVQYFVDDWATIYNGVVDLATYELETEDGACRINCNIGEIGVKTTFNNRYDTKVELSRELSLDGDNLPEYEMLKRNVLFPSKEILLTSSASVGEDTYVSLAGYHGDNWHVGMVVSDLIFVPLGDIKANEIEYFNSDSQASIIDSLHGSSINSDGTINSTYPEGGGIPDGACAFVFQQNNVINSPGYFNIDIRIAFQAWLDVLDSVFVLLIYHCDKDGNVIKVLLHNELLNDTGDITYNLDEDISFNNNGEPLLMKYGEKIAVLFYIKSTIGGNSGISYIVNYIAKTESKISITALSKYGDSNHNVSLIHESLSKLSETISGMTVKSDWYGRENSEVNPISGFGGGSLKAILNGYELRNQNLTSGDRPPINLSFKDLYESLNAIDNIGWGIVEENGALYLRVERWQWFYKDEIIMTINRPNNMKRSIQADSVYTRLKIGYEKYLDEQEVNAIDTFHTNREFYTGLKAIDKQLEKISKLIADPYAIEVTRRQQFNKDTTNWKYDEDVFIVALYFPYHIDGIDSPFMIDVGMTDTIDNDNNGTIISPDTMYNVRISPERNAIRWARRFFEVNSSRESLDYTAGTGNVTAIGSPNLGNDSAGLNYYLEDSGEGAIISERDDIAKKTPLLKPEILSFDFPITFDQYAAILANPYGIIVVDGKECYIQKVTPSLIERKASFELIPKKV